MTSEESFHFKKGKKNIFWQFLIKEFGKNNFFRAECQNKIARFILFSKNKLNKINFVYLQTILLNSGNILESSFCSSHSMTIKESTQNENGRSRENHRPNHPQDYMFLDTLMSSVQVSQIERSQSCCELLNPVFFIQSHNLTVF